MKRNFKVLINNSTNINKTHNHLSPQIIEHKKDHDIWCWKSRPWLGSGTKSGGVNMVILMLLLLLDKYGVERFDQIIILKVTVFFWYLHPSDNPSFTFLNMFFIIKINIIHSPQ